MKIDALGNKIFINDFELSHLANVALLMKNMGLIPTPKLIEDVRLFVCKHLINRVSQEKISYLNKDTLIFYAFFKPRGFERNRQFRANIFKSLETIQELYIQIPCFRGLLPPLLKSRKLADILIQMYDIPLKAESLTELMKRAIIRGPIADFTRNEAYLNFKKYALAEFARAYDDLPLAQKERPREFRNFETQLKSLNPQLFFFLCWERHVFLAVLNQIIVKGFYGVADIPKKIPMREARRLWLLAFMPSPIFAYKIPIFSSPVVSFFISDDEITRLILRVIIFKQTEDENGVNLVNRLNRIWRAFLNVYPLYIYFLDEEIEQGLRGKKGRRRQLNPMAQWLRASAEFFGTNLAKAEYELYTEGKFPLLKQQDSLAAPANQWVKPTCPDGPGKTGGDIHEECFGNPITEAENFLKEKAAFTPIEIRRFMMRFNDEENITAIAREEGVTRQAIIDSLRNCRTKIDQAIQKKKITRLDINDIFKRYHGGYSLSSFGGKSLYSGDISEKSWKPSNIDWLILKQFFYK